MVKSLIAGAFAGLVLFCASASTAQTVIPLSDLEVLIPDAPAVTIATLDESSQNAALAAHNARRAGEFTMGFAGGSYRELITQTTAHQYIGATPTLGVRFPLGTSFEDQESLLQDSAVLAQRHVDVQTARQDALRVLRTQYAIYWAAQRKAALTQTFLADENDVQEALRMRVNAHLALASDQLAIASDYDLARKNATQFAREEERALAEIGIVTGREFAPFIADDPYIAQQCDSAADFTDTVIATNPALIALNAQLHRADDLAALAHRTPLEAGLSLEQTATTQSPGGAGLGRSTTIGVDLRMPLSAQRMGDARRAEYENLVNRLQAQIALQTREVSADARSVFAAQKEALDNEKFAQATRAATSEGMREQLLRRGLFSDTTIEKTSQGRFTFYQSALSEIDARTDLATRVAEAAALCDGRCAHIVSLSLPPLSTYVWNSRRLLLPDANDGTFQDEAAGGRFDSLLLSFNAEQLRGLTQDLSQRDALHTFIQTAHTHHVRVGLLLGDPQWTLPQSRGELISIVRALTGYAFDELHLDIEPRQLSMPEKSLPYLFAELAHTVDIVADASPWPIALDVNYRDLRYLPLEHMKIRTITLMMYIANPERVAEIARPLLDAHPEIRFEIAQSVEPVLSTEESYASKGRAAFLHALSTLKNLLPEKNFAGAVVQSYDDYKRMNP